MDTCLQYAPVYSTVLTAGPPAWNGSAVSIEEMSGSGVYTISISPTAIGIIAGLTREIQPTGYTHIEHGFYFTHSTYQVIESGQLKGPITEFTPDAIFHIVRSVNTVYYCISSTLGGSYGVLPGDLIATSSIPSAGTVFLGASLYNAGDTILTTAFALFTSGEGRGRFAMQGLCGDVFKPHAMGYFGATGSASGSMFEGISGTMTLRGLSSNYAYDEARGYLVLGGSAGSEIAPSISGGNGVFTMGTLASGGEWLPSAANGYFALPGKVSDRPYADIMGGFELFGHTEGSRAAPANWFSISLLLRDQNDPHAIARFAPVKVFPGYSKDDATISVSVDDLRGITSAACDPVSGNWVEIVKAMLVAINTQYESLDSTEQPIMTRPWIFEGVSVIPIDGNDMATIQQRKTTIQYSFVVDYANQTVVSE